TRPVQKTACNVLSSY
ncbi:TRAP transporter solute receptor, TAXI family protein, partial [Vibrio parahaemolyticus AQ3810]